MTIAPTCKGYDLVGVGDPVQGLSLTALSNLLTILLYGDQWGSSNYKQQK